MQVEPGVRTVQEPSEFADEPVKGSRFVALVAPAVTESEARRVVEDARRRWPDASHHCWAWRLQDGSHRSSDDGEPGGSAGRPILAQIEGHGMADVAVVVARWFGGTKLGVGGLIRAYGGCAGRALDRASVVVRIPDVFLRVSHLYDDTGVVQAVVGAHHLEVKDTSWSERVTLTLVVPEPAAAKITAEIIDRTSGRATVDPG